MTKLFLAALICLTACGPEKKEDTSNIAQEKLNLMAADEKFSALSEQKGMKMAFIEYMDSNAILLRPAHLPFVGAKAVDYLLRQNDTGYTMQWKPKNAMVSASGDLGFTYGIWALRPKTVDTTMYGTYVSVWKKQADGTWKFVLDSGNEGIDAEGTNNY